MICSSHQIQLFKSTNAIDEKVSQMNAELGKDTDNRLLKYMSFICRNKFHKCKEIQM